eukprot:1983007-Pyramimonas_sp.AAC.1
MKQALKEQNGYMVQKLARLIAGKRRGPRQRKFAVVPGSTASAKAWAQRLKLEPEHGGCSAIPYTIEETRRDMQEEVRERVEDSEAVYRAAEDWREMAVAVWKLKFWRAWPSWSTPPECLRIVFHPRKVNERRPQAAVGVGFHQELPRIVRTR